MHVYLHNCIKNLVKQTPYILRLKNFTILNYHLIFTIYLSIFVTVDDITAERLKLWSYEYYENELLSLLLELSSSGSCVVNMMRSVFFTLIFQTIHFLREVKVNTAPWETAYGLKAWIGMNFVYFSPTSLDVTAPTYVPVSNDAFSTRAQNRDTNGRKFWTATSTMFCSCWKVKKQQCMIKWNKVLSLVKK